MVWKNTHLLCLERHKLNAEVAQWEKAQLSSSHHICHIQLPKDLTFKIVLHGFTKKWKPESKRLNSRTSGVKNSKKKCRPGRLLSGCRTRFMDLGIQSGKVWITGKLVTEVQCPQYLILDPPLLFLMNVLIGKKF